MPSVGQMVDSDPEGRLKAARLTRLIKLLTASVGPLLTWAWCQAAISNFQRTSVRPRERASIG
jgi:hypothetical protein